MTILEGFKKIKKIQDKMSNIPYHVWRIMPGHKDCVAVFDDQISIANDGDLVTVDELRKAIEWYVEQLHGEVKWKD
jgi:hypothetical protein